MVEGNSRAVEFESSQLFTDSQSQLEIHYKDMLSVRGNSLNTIIVTEGNVAKAVIFRPTIMNMGRQQFLVYPGEKITVTKAGNREYVMTTNENKKRRNRELKFFTLFSEVNEYPAADFKLNATPNDILILEKNMKEQIASIKMSSKNAFDSLQKQLDVSKKFRKETKNFLFNRYDASLLFFYRQYADTLKAHHIYNEKLLTLVKHFNTIKNKEQLRYNATSLNELFREVFPFKESTIKTEAQYLEIFEAISRTFSGISKDYLLSRFMYNAIIKKTVTDNLFRSYYLLCNDAGLKKMVKNIGALQLGLGNKDDKNNDLLLYPDAVKTIDLNKFISSQKGKIIVLDFWAHWCVPCQEDIPYLKELSNEYKNNDVVFIKISIDKEIQAWRKAVIADASTSIENYLLVNADNSSLVKNNSISAIPRYIIFDKTGKIANADAPGPKQVEFKYFLDSLLNKNFQAEIKLN